MVCYAAIGFSVAFGVSGQLLMKWAAMQSLGHIITWIALLQLILALAVYSLGVFCWIFALRYIRLSVAYSLSSMNYIGILFGSYYWFGEQITLLQLVGALCIFIGVALVVLRSSER